MAEAGHLLTGALATAALSLLGALFDLAAGGCVGVGVSLFLWAAGAASLWMLVLAVLALWAR